MHTTVKQLKKVIRAVLQESRYGRLMENKFLNSYKASADLYIENPDPSWLNMPLANLSQLPPGVASQLAAVTDELTKCEDCDGSGTMDDHDCEYCDGSGIDLDQKTTYHMMQDKGQTLYAIYVHDYSAHAYTMYFFADDGTYLGYTA